MVLNDGETLQLIFQQSMYIKLREISHKGDITCSDYVLRNLNNIIIIKIYFNLCYAEPLPNQAGAFQHSHQAVAPEFTGTA